MKELERISNNVEALGRFFKIKRSSLVADSKLLLISINETLEKFKEKNQFLDEIHENDIKVIETFKKDLAVEKSNFSKLERDIESLKISLNRSKNDYRKSQDELDNARISIVEHCRKEVEFKKNLAEKDEEYLDLKCFIDNKIDDFESKVSGFNKQIEDLELEKNILLDEVNIAKNNIEEYDSNERKLELEIKNYGVEVSDLRSKIERQTAEIKDLRLKSQVLSEKADQAYILELLLEDNNAPFPEIKAFSKLLENDFIALANKESSLPEEALAYKELQTILNEMKLIANFSGIKNKAMVVLSGGFSSGKSQFLNSLSAGYKKGSKTDFLKVGTTPTTAVPTYVQSSEDLSQSYVTAYTAKGCSVSLTKEQFHKLTHNYVNQLTFDIRSIMPFASLSYPMRIENTEELSFVDTPGIDSSSKGTTGNDKTTAEQFINQASALLWFVSIKSSGTIGIEDLKFLSSIQSNQPDLPIYIVANQADTNTEDQIEDKLYEFEEVLHDNHIKYSGISAYSGFTGIEYEYLRKPLFEFLEECNKSHNLFEDLRSRLDSVFNRYYKAFESDIKQGKALKKAFDNLTLSILSNTGDIGLQESIKPYLDEIELKLQVHGLEKLHNDFSKLHVRMQECIDQLFVSDSVHTDESIYAN